MILSTLTSKGQTTIPKEIRDYLRLRTGDEIAFYIQNGLVVIKPMTGNVSDLKGCLKKYASRQVSVEEMDRSIRGEIQMIGLDTNVLVRYFVQDNKAEAQKATEVIEDQCSSENPGFIHDIVLCELVWVLESCYGCSKEVIWETLEKILATAQFQVAHRTYVWEAIQAFKASKADFSDCLAGVKNSFSGCRKTMTFDKDLKDSSHFSVL